MNESKTAVVIGATSDIAQATLPLLAADGYRFILVGRDEARLTKVQSQHGGEIYVWDAEDVAAIPAMFEELDRKAKKIDLAYIAYGFLPPAPGNSQTSVRDIEDTIWLNLTSVLLLLKPLAARMSASKGGTIAVISSVAGDRGRYSNWIYAAAKAGLNAALSGLRAEMHPFGVKVITLKPGFTDTRMTAAMKKGLLFVSAERAAKSIHRAIRSGKENAYIPGFWWLIMSVLTALPEFIFKRLKI